MPPNSGIETHRAYRFARAAFPCHRVMPTSVSVRHPRLDGTKQHWAMPTKSKSEWLSDLAYFFQGSGLQKKQYIEEKLEQKALENRNESLKNSYFFVPKIKRRSGGQRIADTFDRNHRYRTSWSVWLCAL